MNERAKTVCFTGHRDIPAGEGKRLSKKLDEVIEKLYNRGIIYYGAGGACGFDMLAERAVLRARERHGDIRLILVLPCRDQDKNWPNRLKAEYADILALANKAVYASERYTNGCMHARNRRLVDFSSVCVAYMTKRAGGTAYTVDYALKNGLEVINLALETE